MTVIIEINSPLGLETIVLPDAAMQRARLSFNPSSVPRVNRIKALAAALYAELEAIPNEVESRLQASAGAGNSIPARPIETARREAATAATHIQAGAMFAVSAATAHLS